MSNKLFNYLIHAAVYFFKPGDEISSFDAENIQSYGIYKILDPDYLYGDFPVDWSIDIEDENHIFDIEAECVAIVFEHIPEGPGVYPEELSFALEEVGWGTIEDFEELLDVASRYYEVSPTNPIHLNTVWHVIVEDGDTEDSWELIPLYAGIITVYEMTNCVLKKQDRGVQKQG